MEKIKLTYDQAEGVGEPAWEIDDGDEGTWAGHIVKAEAEAPIGEATLIIIPAISPEFLNGFESGEITLKLRRVGDDS